MLDYGEHDLVNPVPQDTGVPWICRLDPFSTYRPTFEVRTYRLCRRALMFHHFPADANVGINCLVRSTDFTHTPPAPLPDPSQPFYSYLLSATQTGYTRDGRRLSFRFAAASASSSTPKRWWMKPYEWSIPKA